MFLQPLPIVICGESLLDVFPDGHTAQGLRLDAVVGGSPLNVAIGVQRLGVPALFFGAVSTDFLGERIVQALRDEGLSEAALVACDAPTTLSLVGVDARGVPSYRFYGRGGADRQVLPEHMARLPDDVAAFHFGSYACVVDPIGTTIRALTLARRERSVIAYDPNVRLNVEPDLAVWRAQVDWMVRHAHLIKLSDEDFGLLYPGAEPDELAARWLASGVSLVMMTQGGAGARGWTRAGHCHVTAPAVTVRDTVGAGDTFQAATLVALSERGRLSPTGLDGVPLALVEQVMDFAARAAALTCTRRGPDMPHRNELPARAE